MDELVLIDRESVLEILYELKDIPHLNAGYVQDAIRKVRLLPNQGETLYEEKH